MSINNLKEPQKSHLIALLNHLRDGTLCGPLGRYAMAKALIDGPSDFSDAIFFDSKEWLPDDFPLATSDFYRHREIAFEFVVNQVGDWNEAVEAAFYVLAWMPVGWIYDLARGYESAVFEDLN